MFNFSKYCQTVFQWVGTHLFSPAMDVSSDCPTASLTFAIVCLRTLALLMDRGISLGFFIFLINN